MTFALSVSSSLGTPTVKLLWERHLIVSQLPFPSSQYCLEQYCMLYITIFVSTFIIVDSQPGVLFTYEYLNLPEYTTKFFVGVVNLVT